LRGEVDAEQREAAGEGEFEFGRLPLTRLSASHFATLSPLSPSRKLRRTSTKPAEAAA